MDQERIGKFILELRKKNNLTQSKFAEKLNVTAQAVSKWENGRGIPDIEIIRNISQEFNVDIESILSGENIKKKDNKKMKLVIGLAITFVLVLSLVFGGFYFSHNDFEFSNLKSSHEDFNIKGVAAYSKDKKSIYISDIEYLNNQVNDDKYAVMECILYESSDDGDNKISQCGHIDKSTDYKVSDAKNLSELLKNIEFNVDDYKSTCKNLKSSDLYISINVMDINKKIITYEVPLQLDSDCSD